MTTARGRVAELEEVLVLDRFEELAEVLRAPGASRLEEVLSAHFALLVEDELFEKVTARAAPALARTAAVRQGLVEDLAALLDRARAAGEVRAEVGAPEVLLLVCALAHAVRGAGLPPGAPRAQALLRVLLDGLRGRG
ncbi:hypothetical protein [Kineococcus vitellinus]|uniref:SbtR family transcriptional regulator n=1 Tax=Kineococcus vitellinus TaxID=2696565 RepID=UPI0030B7F893